MFVVHFEKPCGFVVDETIPPHHHATEYLSVHSSIEQPHTFACQFSMKVNNEKLPCSLVLY